MTISPEVNFDSTDLATLYDRDYYLWLSATSKLLQQGQLQALDIRNLVEEIEDMGRSEKRAIESNLRVLLMHLLKYQYQPEKRTSSWKSTIREHRKRLQKAFRDSPSLKRYFEDVFYESYQDARELASDETEIEIDRFPEQSPFTPDETLDPNYLPSA